MDKFYNLVTPIVMAGDLSQVSEKASGDIYKNIVIIAIAFAVPMAAISGLCWLFGQKAWMKTILIGLFGGLALIGLATILITVWRGIVGL